jgi:hypothetical protein
MTGLDLYGCGNYGRSRSRPKIFHHRRTEENASEKSDRHAGSQQQT